MCIYIYIYDYLYINCINKLFFICLKVFTNYLENEHLMFITLHQNKSITSSVNITKLV